MKEYEQAFSQDPDEAMLQAYGALLAGKVAEADTDADDVPSPLAPPDASPRATCPELTDNPLEAPPQRGADIHSNPTGCQQGSRGGQHDSKKPHFKQRAGSTLSDSAAHATGAETYSVVSKTAEAERNARSAHDSQMPKATRAPGGLAVRKSWLDVITSLGRELQQQPARWCTTMIACFGLQLAMTLYFGLVHQRCGPPLQPCLCGLSQINACYCAVTYHRWRCAHVLPCFHAISTDRPG